MKKINIKKKKHLEMQLEQIPPHPKPKVKLEQYTTPSIIASDILWNAKTLNDIENKNIIDLGCGTGIFTIGSAILNAKTSQGFDIDPESLETAENTSQKLGIENIKFHQIDVKNTKTLDDYIDSKADTLFQNPPFGSQKQSIKGADTSFIDLAVKSAKIIYSFHMQSTEEYIIDYFKDKNCDVTHLFHYKFPIGKTYSFHKKETYLVNVSVIRARNLK